MTRGIPKKRAEAEQLRKKRAQAASGLAKRPRPSVGRAKAMPAQLPPHSYPVKRAALGKRQVPGGAG